MDHQPNQPAGLDGDFNALDKIYRRRQEDKARNEKLYKENSKKRFAKFLEKKFKTTMIGSLAKFEDKFGHLWGHGQDKLTVEQVEYRKLWELVRTEILNNGNNQLRATQDELMQYNVSVEPYRTQFVIQSIKKGNQ